MSAKHFNVPTVSSPPLLPFSCLGVSNLNALLVSSTVLFCASLQSGQKVTFLISKDELLSVIFVFFLCCYKQHQMYHI